MTGRRIFVAFAAFLGALGLGLAAAVVRLWSELPALRWERPAFLAAIALVPLLAHRATRGEDARVPRLLVGSVRGARGAPVGIRARLRDVPGAVRTAALVLAILALARPQSVGVAESDERSGIDVMVVLDLSSSMRAVDLRPTRLGAAKTVVQEFVERRPDDRIGAVVFAGDAFPLSPLTFDHARVAQLVGKMEIGAISRDGTAIGEGLGAALSKLETSTAKSKVIVLLTDGDSNAGQMSPSYATELAQQLGVRIYTVQMGNGDEVDVEVDRDPITGRPTYARARFPVNPDLLRKIAKDTGGESYIANQTEELRSSMHAILDKLKKTKFEAATGDAVERYPFFLFPAAALVVIEAFLRAFVLRRFP